MVDWSHLLIPIALSAVLVFITSSVIHMALKYHNVDYRQIPNEDAVLEAMRKGALSPGQYIFPHCKDHKNMGSPEMTQKFQQGPVGSMYVRPSGAMQLGPFLGKWVAYSIVISIVVAYLARAELHPGASYLSVFRLTGTTAWLAYAWQSPADSIWKGKPWAITFKDMFDGLVYALMTAGSFACMWPHA